MKGIGIKIQIGRTDFNIIAWPFYWSVETSMMQPRLFGFGAWITKYYY